MKYVLILQRFSEGKCTTINADAASTVIVTLICENVNSVVGLVAKRLPNSMRWIFP